MMFWWLSVYVKLWIEKIIFVYDIKYQQVKKYEAVNSFLWKFDIDYKANKANRRFLENTFLQKGLYWKTSWKKLIYL